MTDRLTLLLEFLGGVALLAVAAWVGWRIETGRRGKDVAPRSDLPALKDFQARARRFDSGMDRTRGEKRGENSNSRINIIRERP